MALSANAENLIIHEYKVVIFHCKMTLEVAFIAMIVRSLQY